MANGHAVDAQVTLTGSNVNTIVSVYTGTAVNALTQVYSPDCFLSTPSTCVRFNVLPGTTYSIQVDCWYAQTGPMTIAVTQTVVPPNDLFLAPMATLPSTGTASPVSGSTQGASLEIGEPLAGKGASGSVWYRFSTQASATANVR